MTNKEIGGQPGFTPQAGAFGETAAYVRELDKQGLLKSYEDKKWAQELTEQARRDTMFAQMQGFDVGLPEELPEHSKMFPGATNSDGSVRFSNRK